MRYLFNLEKNKMSIENEFTVEELIDEIRKATDLIDLQKLVGPSEFELEDSKMRLKQIDNFLKKQENVTITQYQYRQYERLAREQVDFEIKYF
jgi:hypothetical protein